MLEFILSATLTLTLLVGAGSLFRHEWDRVRCAHLVFEATHARLVGAPFYQHEVRFQESHSSVLGQASCGKSFEVVELPRLEPRQP